MFSAIIAGLISMTLGAPVQAADKVVIIPMGGGHGTTSGPLAPVPKTGQTTMYMTSDDGALQKGVSLSSRFADNGDGTVTDNLTGLIWLKKGDCDSFYSGDTTDTTRSWADAISAVNKLANGYCGLTDASQAGNWRLPNVKELQSLIDYGQGGNYNPAIPQNSPFYHFGTYPDYWSSTSTMVGGFSFVPMPETYAWCVNFVDGGTVKYFDKTGSHAIIAVRGGQ